MRCTSLIEELSRRSASELLRTHKQEEGSRSRFRKSRALLAKAFFPIIIMICATFFPCAVCNCPRAMQQRLIAFSNASLKQNKKIYGNYPSVIRRKVIFPRPTESSWRRFCTETATEMKSRCFQDALVKEMLYRVRQCNHVPTEVQDSLVDFYVDKMKVGKMSSTFAQRLSSTPLFAFINNEDPNDPPCKSSLFLTTKAGATETERTAAVQKLIKKLAEEGIIKGWRDEFYPVISSFYDTKVPLLVERAAAPHFGIQQYGVHINGYVKDEVSGKPKQMWLARRSRSKSKYPGMLDHIVAGGQPNGMSPLENVIKECNEEAGIPNDLARKASPAGAVSYEYFSQNEATGSQNSGTIERSCLFCYDLELPPDFVPTAVDGEVEEFFLWDLDEVAETVHREYEDPIKPNCYLVIIDFLLRWGYITPESPGYLDLLRELRGGQCS